MGNVLQALEARTKVRLRVHMKDRQAAAAAMDLPVSPTAVEGVDPAALWLGPEQWLLVSDERNASTLIADVESRLGDMLFSATDVTAAFRCYRLADRDRRSLLATGSGIDFESLAAGHCVRTYFAKIPLIVVSLDDTAFELYVDVSHAAWFEAWLSTAAAGRLSH